MLSVIHAQREACVHKRSQAPLHVCVSTGAVVLMLLLLQQLNFSSRLDGLEVKPLCQRTELRTSAVFNWVARVHPERLQRITAPPGRSASAAHRCAHNTITLAGINVSAAKKSHADEDAKP